MNFPKKPINPWLPQPGPEKPYPNPDCGCPTPPPPPGQCPPPPPPFPECPPPGFGKVPPVPPILEGASWYEVSVNMAQRVNQCIEQWNSISGNAFAYMREAVNAARVNGVYYSDKEVSYQEGYNEDDGCTYSLVEKKAVDCHGKPILVNLVPAYNNTTNSGVKQPIFDVSFITSANMVITAVPADAVKWTGPAFIDGSPMPGEPMATGDSVPSTPVEQPEFVYGFNRNGVLRWFGNNVTVTALEQNQMVDVIGKCIPILNDGKLTPMAEAMTEKGAITAIGYRSSDGSVFFFQCSAQDQPGMQGVNVARLFEGYGCVTAVITSFIPGATKTVSNGMLYMGQMCQVPQAGIEPKNLAYWVISKRDCFRNEFEHTIAELVQTTGQNAWNSYLLGVEVMDFNDRITQNTEDILKEIERATQAEQDLKQDITDETDRATAAEAQLQQNINAEQNRATQAEAALDKKITDETQRATTAEADLAQKIVDETQRATAAENKIAEDLSAEKLRAQGRENQIQAALDAEISKRIAADNDLLNAIEQEVLARRAADTALENTIDATKKQLQQDINDVQQQVNGMAAGSVNLPYLKLTGGTMTGNIIMSSGNTVTLGRDPTTDMEAATKAYVDAAVGGGGSTPGGDVSKEYVDQQVDNLQTQLEGKVSKSGDEMTGPLNMAGNEIQAPVLSSATGVRVTNGTDGPGRLTNLAMPQSDMDATSKEYVDQAISDATAGMGGDYVPTAGGAMTGDLNMDGDSVINFNDPAARTLSARLRSTSVGQVNRGSVYNDGEMMVIKSAAGPVGVKGTALSLSDGEGADIPVQGISAIQRDGTDLVKFGLTQTELAGPVAVVNAAGGGAKLAAGLGDFEAVDIGVSEIREHEDSTGVKHLDVNVGTSTGAVYINRTNNGDLVEGGTGELHVTEIHAPQQLNLRPGTNVNLGSKKITGLAYGSANTDAAAFGQIQAAINNAFLYNPVSILKGHEIIEKEGTYQNTGEYLEQVVKIGDVLLSVKLECNFKPSVQQSWSIKIMGPYILMYSYNSYTRKVINADANIGILFFGGTYTGNVPPLFNMGIAKAHTDFVLPKMGSSGSSGDMALIQILG